MGIKGRVIDLANNKNRYSKMVKDVFTLCCVVEQYSGRVLVEHINQEYLFVSFLESIGF